MGFLERLFGSGGKETKARELSLGELKDYVNKKTEKGFNDLQLEVFSKFAEVKHVSSEIRADLDEFKKRDLLAEEGNKVLRKIVSTSQKNLIGQMEALVEKLDPPEKKDFETLKNYCLNSSSLLQKEINSFGKSITYTGILLKKEVKTLGEYIRELNKLFLQLKKLFEKNPLLKTQLLKEDIKLLSSLQRELDELDSSVLASESAVKQLAEENAALSNELAGLKNSPERQQFKSLLNDRNKLSGQMEDLRNQLVSLFGRIDKPLKRFIKAVESNHYIIESSEEELLRTYLNKPFHAVRQDPKGEKLKKILLEVKKAISEGKISLKEKEKQKKLNALDELLRFSFFDNAYWPLNRLESDLAAVEKSIGALKISREIALVEEKMGKLGENIREQENALLQLKESSQKKGEEALSLKGKIENLLQETISESIEVKIG